MENPTAPNDLLQRAERTLYVLDVYIRLLQNRRFHLKLLNSITSGINLLITLYGGDNLKFHITNSCIALISEASSHLALYYSGEKQDILIDCRKSLLDIISQIKQGAYHPQMWEVYSNIQKPLINIPSAVYAKFRYSSS